MKMAGNDLKSSLISPCPQVASPAHSSQTSAQPVLRDLQQWRSCNQLSYSDVELNVLAIRWLSLMPENDLLCSDFHLLLIVLIQVHRENTAFLSSLQPTVFSHRRENSTCSFQVISNPNDAVGNLWHLIMHCFLIVYFYCPLLGGNVRFNRVLIPNSG